MLFPFLFKNKEKLIAIFDIGSGSVGGAIVRIFTDGKTPPVIIKSSRTDIKVRTSFDFSTFMKDMSVALDATVKDLYNKKIGAPHEVYCVLASPWYLSLTRTIKFKEDKQFIVNRKLVNNLVNQEITKLNDSFKEKYSNFESLPEMIENHTMSILLNGYQVNEPFGRKCKSIEMDMAISLSPKLCLDSIRNTISKTFHHPVINFSSFTIDSYIAIKNKYIIPDSYLLLDVSGEITDVGIVTKGVLKSIISFPFGKNTFYKYISTKLGIELRDARELFGLYCQGTLSLEFKKKVMPLFKSVSNSWAEAFKKSVETLPRVLTLPSTIFLTADNDMKNWFKDVLEQEENIIEMFSEHKCHVVTLNGREFLDLCDIKDCDCDPFLMIEAISISRKLEEK